jgi:hypothetical protein
MQNTLTRRVAALEAKKPAIEQMTIFRVFVSPGNPNPAINHIQCQGENWTRLAGESEEDFRDRASREVKRNAWGVASLLASESQEGGIDYAN